LSGEKLAEVHIDDVLIDNSVGRGSGLVGHLRVLSSCRAGKSTSWCAVRGSVALLTFILNTITTSWETTISSARVRSKVRVHGSIVTFLVSFNQSITANGVELEIGNWAVVASLEAT